MHAMQDSNSNWIAQSGQAGGAELRELLAHNESMETDQPESNFGGPAASASGSATPTSGRGARDAAG